MAVVSEGRDKLNRPARYPDASQQRNRIHEVLHHAFRGSAGQHPHADAACFHERPDGKDYRQRSLTCARQQIFSATKVKRAALNPGAGASERPLRSSRNGAACGSGLLNHFAPERAGCMSSRTCPPEHNR